MEFIKRTLDFPSCTKKIMACTYHHCNVDTWWLVNTCTRLCCSTIYLHTFLGLVNVYSWNFCFYHDSAACLLKMVRLLLLLKRNALHEKSMMLDFHHAIQYCLKEASISAKQIDNVVFYEKPFVKFERLLETYLAFAPKGFISFR